MKHHHFLGKLFLAGVDKSKAHASAERIILANVMFLIVPIIIIFSYLMDYREFLVPVSELNFDQFTRGMFGTASLLCYFLNRKGWFLYSRWIYLASWVAFWLVLDPVVQGTSDDYYFHFDLSIIGFSIVTQILVSYRKEKLAFACLMTFSLIFIFYQQKYLLHFDANKDVNGPFLAANQYTYFTSIYYWAIFNLIIGYLIFIYEKSNAQLADQNVQLDRLTTNLEEMVADRTEDLRTKQEELIVKSKQLQESEEKYRKLFTNSFEGIARLKLDKALDTTLPKDSQLDHLKNHLRIAECNDVFTSLYRNGSRRDFTGERLFDIMKSESSFARLFERYLDKNYTLNGEVSREQLYNRENWFINHMTAHIDEGHIQWIWLNKLDITESSKQEEERNLLLKNLEEYAFQTSHELRGPLSRLLGLTSLLLTKNVFNEDELPEMLRHIKNTSIEIDEVIKMMNEVLSRSSYESKLTKKS